jgi:carotenoid 1,2-hydratase
LLERNINHHDQTSGPDFSKSVAPQGYGWWYADAISDDGQFGFSIIAMIGSVFSPYYAWSGRHTPYNHVALNVGLYGKGVKRWTMTERGENDLSQSTNRLVIGPSHLEWDGNSLLIHINEWANPIFRKVEGTIRLTPNALTKSAFQLDGNGKHFWQPIAPLAHAEVKFSKPELNWTGKGYIDSNFGAEPLESGFKNWDWSRGHTSNGTGILYDAFTRDGENRQLVLKFDKDGNVENLHPEPRIQLNKGTIWRVGRSTLCENGFEPKTFGMLEDTPFYTRSRISSRFAGENIIAIHESLDCDRFASQWVRCLLPFRMPRTTGKKP